MAMKLDSPAFVAGGPIPARFTCEGENHPRPLRWSGAPAGTAAFVLSCDDPDAPGGTFHHWAVYNIPAGWTGLDGDPGPKIPQAVNDFRKPGYGGPCPPPGDPPHHYHFRLSALSALITAPAGLRCPDVQRLAEPLVLETAELVGTFGR